MGLQRPHLDFVDARGPKGLLRELLVRIALDGHREVESRAWEAREDRLHAALCWP